VPAKITMIHASVFAGLLAVTAPALAQGEDGGVGEGEDPAQVRAEELFQQGAALQEEWRLEEAIAKYREALGHWQHPQIYVNLSRALEKHGDLLDAHRNLERALRLDVGRMDEEQRAIALALRADLEARLARLEVRCDTPGAEVSVDGQRWFVGPGQRARMTVVGEHTVIVKKPGYFTVTRSRALLAGQSAVVTVRMQPDRGLVVERRWPEAGPWTVFAAGGAVTAVGAALLGRADSLYDDTARDLARECALSCEPGARAAVTVAMREQRWGILALVVGGTAALAGTTMLLLNQPRTLRNQEQGGADFQILPMASPQAAGMSALWRF
jgi:tetratricopeptide (TPR) repeat protein